MGANNRYVYMRRRAQTRTHARTHMQLIRRNEELAQLCEKIRVQRKQLARGEVAYRVRASVFVRVSARMAMI